MKRKDEESAVLNKLEAYVEYNQKQNLNDLIEILNTEAPRLNETLQESIELTKKFDRLEINCREQREELLEKSKEKRIEEWDEFMNKLTDSYSEINKTYKLKEEELINNYKLKGVEL